MSSFCPDGYVPAQEALRRALQYWFPDKWAQIETLVAGNSAIKDETEGWVAGSARASRIPDALIHECADSFIQTLHRLRNHLHQGLLKAYYFGGLVSPSGGRQTLPPDFWATSVADGVLESGSYLPLGRPSKWYDPPLPRFPLFFLEADLVALLSEQQNPKKPFPEAKLPELVAALRNLGDLPTRAAQRKALCELPEFRSYRITDDIFREAAKQAPRPPGRPRNRS
jgi:hypothetical protein